MQFTWPFLYRNKDLRIYTWFYLNSEFYLNKIPEQIQKAHWLFNPGGLSRLLSWLIPPTVVSYDFIISILHLKCLKFCWLVYLISQLSNMFILILCIPLEICHTCSLICNMLTTSWFWCLNLVLEANYLVGNQYQQISNYLFFFTFTHCIRYFNRCNIFFWTTYRFFYYQLIFTLFILLT